MTRAAWGDGVATVTTDSSPRPGVVLDTWYPAPAVGDPTDADGEPPRALRALVDEDAMRHTRREVVRTVVDLDAQGNVCAITLEHASQRTALSQFSYERVAA